jgi:hypothetical protein
MCYLNNITFYLSLKANSLVNTQDHPVLDVLVKTRTTLEALEEIEENGMGELVDEFDAMLADMDDDDEGNVRMTNIGSNRLYDSM